MDNLKKMYFKYKEPILYIFFGVLTTLCNIIVYYIISHIFKLDAISSTIIAFVISVLFAFLTNRKYVFNSTTKGAKQITGELMRFFGSRLFSGGLDVLIMYIFVTQLCYNDMVIKILSNVLVVILNYIFSKIFVFKKKA